MSQIKKSGLEKQSRLSLEEVLKCQECLHFKQFPHPSHKKVCSSLGVRAFGIAPVCFTPDYTKVITNIDEFVAISAIFSTKTPQQKRILLSMLRQKSKPNQLPIGSLVYLNIRGREYIENYYCAYIIGYTSARQIVLAGSPTNSRGRTFFAYLRSDDSLLTPELWAKKFRLLKSKGKVTDPSHKTPRDITAKIAADDYEVPTIDTMPKSEREKLEQRKNPRTIPLTEGFAF